MTIHAEKEMKSTLTMRRKGTMIETNLGSSRAVTSRSVSSTEPPAKMLRLETPTPRGSRARTVTGTVVTAPLARRLAAGSVYALKSGILSLKLQAEILSLKLQAEVKRSMFENRHLCLEAVAIGASRGTPTQKETDIGEVGDPESDGTTTDCEGSGTAEVHRQRTEKLRAKRGERRIRDFLQTHAGVPSWATMLEMMTVAPSTARMYKAEVDTFVEYCTKEQRHLTQDHEIDSAPVDYMNVMHFSGHQAWRGEKLFAGFVNMHPEFGKMGIRALPRSWKKAWRRWTPGRSRRPIPLPVWCGIAVYVAEHVSVMMAVGVLLALSAYLRPSELLRLRGESLVPPSSASPNRCLLMHPSEGAARSKTGTADDSITLDSSYLKWLDPVWGLLHIERRGQPLFSFDYPELLQALKKAVKYWKCGAVVPYQWRHSGPSIDRAIQWRPLSEVQKRGRWAKQKSVARYEKAARLGVMWNELDVVTKIWMLLCEEHLSDLVLGTHRFNKATGA